MAKSKGIVASNRLLTPGFTVRRWMGYTFSNGMPMT
jgi:hypothetical protein